MQSGGGAVACDAAVTCHAVEAQSHISLISDTHITDTCAHQR